MSEKIRELYLRRAGWSPAILPEQAGQWWLKNPRAPVDAKKAAETQVVLDEAAMMYFMEHMSPQAKAVVDGRVAHAVLSEMVAMLQRPPSGKTVEKAIAAVMADPAGRKALRDVAKALRALAEDP